MDEDIFLSIWLGRRDSNPRMPGPKPGALPLGHALIISQFYLINLNISIRQDHIVGYKNANNVIFKLICLKSMLVPSISSIRLI